jgi:hypothetical protein
MELVLKHEHPSTTIKVFAVIWTGLFAFFAVQGFFH